MNRFAEVLDALSYTASRNAKLALLAEYLGAARDPALRSDRGWAMAALTGALSIKQAKPAMIRELVTQRVDPVLFGWSYDFVGDLAETAALIWPEGNRPAIDDPGAGPGRLAPPLTDVVDTLSRAKRGDVPDIVAGWLDGMDATGRWALLKLITGALRIGVSARLAKTALGQAFGQPADAVEEVWHAFDPPYRPVFDWLTGETARPDISQTDVFRPLMLANPIDVAADLPKLDPADYLAEWKWDGIRVQLARRGGAARLYSRTGDDISAAFPDVAETLDEDGVVDGELLVGRHDAQAGWQVAPFNDLQQRLNRKTVTAKMLRDAPAFVRLYDMLFDGPEDIRPLPLVDRRDRLVAWLARRPWPRFDLSALVDFDDWTGLAAIREGAREAGIEGLMLKRRDAPYLAGRPKGPWFKWKRDPLLVDTVLMYAQRGHGKRSSFFSDLHLRAAGAKGDDGGDELVPVGKAYFGFTDEELKAELDALGAQERHARPLRSGDARWSPDLVVEVAFDAVQKSTRHKSGVAMRLPALPPHPLGQAGGGGRPAGHPGGDDRLRHRATDVTPPGTARDFCFAAAGPYRLWSARFFWPCGKPHFADVAQPVEQRIRNAWVGGSSPSIGTIHILRPGDMGNGLFLRHG